MYKKLPLHLPLILDGSDDTGGTISLSTTHVREIEDLISAQKHAVRSSYNKHPRI